MNICADKISPHIIPKKPFKEGIHVSREEDESLFRKGEAEDVRSRTKYPRCESGMQIRWNTHPPELGLEWESGAARISIYALDVYSFPFEVLFFPLCI